MKINASGSIVYCDTKGYYKEKQKIEDEDNSKTEEDIESLSSDKFLKECIFIWGRIPKGLNFKLYDQIIL